MKHLAILLIDLLMRLCIDDDSNIACNKTIIQGINKLVGVRCDNSPET